MTAPERHGLFVAVRAHNDAAHADLAVTDEQIQQTLAAHTCMTPSGGQRATLARAPVACSMPPATDSARKA